jgi:hypothetical protein
MVRIGPQDSDPPYPCENRPERKYYVRHSATNGHPLPADTQLEIGDEVEVRLNLSAKVAMDYVYVRAPRAAGGELSSQLSRHHWEGGLA